MIRHTAVPSDNPGDNRRLASIQDMPTCGANLPAHCINVRKQLMLHRCKHRCTSLIHGSTFAPLQAAMLCHEGSTNSTNALMCQQWHEDNRRQLNGRCKLPKGAKVHAGQQRHGNTCTRAADTSSQLHIRPFQRHSMHSTDMHVACSNFLRNLQARARPNTCIMADAHT